MNNAPLSRRQAFGKLGLLTTGAAIAGVSAATLASAAPAPAAPKAPIQFNVREFGATGDGKTMDQAAIQKAIDAAAAAGGATVHLPSGTYLSGTIQMRDNVTLNLAEGCLILGSTNVADYPKLVRAKDGRTMGQALIFGGGAKNIAITGRGKINGRGSSFEKRDGAPNRPYGFLMVDCVDLLISDVYVQDSGTWTVKLFYCQRVIVRGLRIYSHANYNNDGVDIDSCTDVTMAQCHIDAQDDGICLKSDGGVRCENVVISDCIVSSHCNSIKFGTGSSGGFLNVAITNCAIVAPRFSKVINGRQRGIGGINLECVDGGVMDRIAITNVTIEGVLLPLFIHLGDRKRGASGDKSVLRNVIISNVVATGMGSTGSSITGLPGQLVENVILSNLSFTYEGGGKLEQAAHEVQEKPKAYPEGFMFGDLPAWGLYCRHIKGLKMNNVKLALTAPDARHSLIFDDVEELDIDGLDCQWTPGAAAMARLTQTRQALIRGCRPNAPAGTFLRIEGKEAGGIALMGNDLRRVKVAVEAAPGVPADAVAQLGNLTKEAAK